MLVIRFRRIGKKNKPTYRLVVAEHSFPIDGRYTADLGSYNPHSKALTLKKYETVEWLNKGAKPSNSVARLLEKEKIKHKLVVVIKKKRSPKKVAEEKAEPKAEAPVEETAAEETAVETPAAEETTGTTTEASEKPDTAPAEVAAAEEA